MKKLLCILMILIISVCAVACFEGESGASSSTPSGSGEPEHTHDFGEWQTVTEPTCTVSGLAERYCLCSEKEQKELPTVAHTYADTVVDPTCTEKGYTIHTCACGDTYKDSYTDTVAHSYDSSVVTAPTCTEKGYTTHTCACGDTYKDSYTDTVDHSYDSSVVTVPTYTEEGYTTHFCVCGDSYKDSFTPVLKEEPTSFPLKDMYVVLPEVTTTDNNLLYAKDKLVLGIQVLTGLSLPSGTDTGNEYEILLGNTGRPESEALAAELADGEFAIRAIDNKLVIVAKNDIFLFEAVEYLLDTYIEPLAAADGTEDILLPLSINVTKEGNVNSLYYILMNGEGDLIFNSIPSHSISNDKYYNDGQSYETHIYRRQGGCFNGKSMYQAFLSKNQELAVIAKKDIATGELIYSDPRPMGHANDIAYNPFTDCIYVCNGSTVYVYDANTLEYVETISSAASGTGIEYSPERNVFVFRSGTTFTKASGDLQTNEGLVFASEFTGYTTQGIGSDDTFIYFLICKSLGYNYKYLTYIAVYDWYGNFVRFMTVKIPENFEPENISAVDGQIYIGATSTQPVFTLYQVYLGSATVDGGNSGEDNNGGDVSAEINAEVKESHSLINDFASATADSRIHRRRGGYFDGENFYQAYISAKGENMLGIIAKKNVKTGEIIYSEPMYLGEAKDITYDPKTDTIIVSSRSTSLYVFKADTLEFVRKVNVAVTVNVIDYDEKAGEYVCLNDKELSILDQSFNIKSTVTLNGVTGYISHALATDENGRIYVLYVKGTGGETYTACVAIYESGSLSPVEVIGFTLPESYEPVHLSVVDGDIYVGGCSPQPVATLYKIEKNK